MIPKGSIVDSYRSIYDVVDDIVEDKMDG